MAIKGYKVVLKDYSSKFGNMSYEAGKTYEHDGPLRVCGLGLHFCRKAADCFDYYPFDKENHVFEVEAIGLVKTEGNKSVTNKLVILRELDWHEVLDVANTGTDCTGYGNTGNRNTGDLNTGSLNTGNRNTGNLNTGDLNTGNRNTGNLNTGNLNTGSLNTGSLNTGSLNTGNWNTGSWNTGDWNTGNWNTGNWNTADYQTGFFNTKPGPSGRYGMRLFNKKSDLARNTIIGSRGMEVLRWNYENNWWIYSEDMSYEEKASHPEHECTGGYLKTVPFKEACQMMWANLDDEDKQSVIDIPNFDAAVFKEITGIDVKSLQP